MQTLYWSCVSGVKLTDNMDKVCKEIEFMHKDAVLCVSTPPLPSLGNNC